MLCPFCKEKDTSVVDSRPTEDGTAIRRRRLCGCERKERFTTFERVQFQELTVIKGNGKRAPFDRDKISKSIRIALRKRPIDSAFCENGSWNFVAVKQHYRCKPATGPKPEFTGPFHRHAIRNNRFPTLADDAPKLTQGFSEKP